MSEDVLHTNVLRAVQTIRPGIRAKVVNVEGVPCALWIETVRQHGEVPCVAIAEWDERQASFVFIDSEDVKVLCGKQCGMQAAPMLRAVAMEALRVQADGNYELDWRKIL
jgi:hypothetical protein